MTNMRPTKDNKTERIVTKRKLDISLYLGDYKRVIGHIINYCLILGIAGESGNRTQRS